MRYSGGRGTPLVAPFPRSGLARTDRARYRPPLTDSTGAVPPNRPPPGAAPVGAHPAGAADGPLDRRLHHGRVPLPVRGGRNRPDDGDAPPAGSAAVHLQGA